MALLAVLVASGRAGALSGVCPDGSMFVVQDPSAIPCPEAKQVDPNDMPPLNPEFLPRPYGWEVFNRESDPNNPYNLVDVGGPQAAPDAAGATPPAPTGSAGAPPPAPPTLPSVGLGMAPHGASGPALPQGDRVLELSETEVRDLAAIIEVLQERAPATLVERDAQLRPGLQVRFARSAAFEARLTDALAARGQSPAGPVVVYHVQADRAGAFWGNLTFVQDHVAFSPDPVDPTQFGVVYGELGELAPGGRLLGYAVLPEQADPARPMDVYWDDRLLTAVLSP